MRRSWIDQILQYHNDYYGRAYWSKPGYNDGGVYQVLPAIQSY